MLFQHILCSKNTSVKIKQIPFFFVFFIVIFDLSGCAARCPDVACSETFTIKQQSEEINFSDLKFEIYFENGFTKKDHCTQEEISVEKAFSINCESKQVVITTFGHVVKLKILDQNDQIIRIFENDEIDQNEIPGESQNCRYCRNIQVAMTQPSASEN